MFSDGLDFNRPLSESTPQHWTRATFYILEGVA